MFEGHRDDFFPDLISWAEEHGASCEGFAVTSFGAEGYGLRATRDIKVSSDADAASTFLSTGRCGPEG